MRPQMLWRCHRSCWEWQWAYSQHFPRVNNLMGSAPLGPAHVIKQQALPLQGSRERWGDLGAQPQHVEGFISWGTGLLSTRPFFLIPVLSGLRLSQQHGLQRQVRVRE